MNSQWARMTQRFASIGITDADDDEQRLHKTLLVASSAMIGLAAAVWGVI